LAAKKTNASQIHFVIFDMAPCPTGKRRFSTEALAVEALLEAHAVYHYKPGQGPQTVYTCSTCGDYHFTSRGPAHTKLQEAITSGELSRLQRANQWKSKFR
jgi:hypothetical protein